MPNLHSLIIAGVLAALVPAQSRSALKTELATREAKVDDANALVALAAWAGENDLHTERLRLLHKAIGLDANHAAARAALGYVEHQGKWALAAKVALLERRAHRAEMLAKGFVEVDGIWVDAAEADDAEQGVFYHDGERVSRAEKHAFMQGMVRHPVTGRFIPADAMEQAEQGKFLLPDGSWVDEEDADRYHSDSARPWVLRTEFADIATTLPLSKFEEVKGYVDDAIGAIRPFFGDVDPYPAFRPSVLVCATTGEFQTFGNSIGDERSTFGAFIAASPPILEGKTWDRTPAVANWGEREPWGIYYLRNAAAQAYAYSLGRSLGADLPLWLVIGSGGFAERLYDPAIAKFFGQAHLQAGGIRGLESWGVGSMAEWFDGFAINNDLDDTRLAHNIYQAGLLVSFALYGSDDETLAAAGAVREAVTSGSGLGAAVDALQSTLTEKETELWAYLKQVIENG